MPFTCYHIGSESDIGTCPENRINWYQTGLQGERLNSNHCYKPQKLQSIKPNYQQNQPCTSIINGNTNNNGMTARNAASQLNQAQRKINGIPRRSLSLQKETVSSRPETEPGQIIVRNEIRQTSYRYNFKMTIAQFSM